MQGEREWRCTGCGKLLGMRRGERLHIRFARSHEYVVGLPATGVCRGCGTLNEQASGARTTTLDAAARL